MSSPGVTQGPESVGDGRLMVLGGRPEGTALFALRFLLNVYEEKKCTKYISHLINNASDRGGPEDYSLLSGSVFVYNYLKSLSYFRTQIQAFG